MRHGKTGSHVASTVRMLREYSVQFLLFIQYRTPDHEMVLPTVRVGLPTSINLT